MMNKILTLIFITSIFTANLEVDGGLKVNGPIESQTTDSLLTIISQLEQQLLAIQENTKITTKMISYDVNIQGGIDPIFIEISDIVGDGIEYNNLNRQFNHHILNKTGLRKVPSDSYFDKYENLLSEFIDWFNEYGYSSNYSHKLKL